ncbi:MAG: hypothetical protein LBG96_13555, partial [Tannerella sp.]|nr:hypothetical protein [Tannerella sp.]
MNKKIFTLLAGASLLVGSLITVNAQNPYKDKASGTSTDFSDILTADAVKKLPASYDSYFYLLSVTGLANASGSNAATKFTTDLGNSQYVLFVDEQNSTPGNEIMNLRFDDLAKLDSEYDYSYVNPANADYKSSKFGAIRRASWCVEYNTGTVSGSNVIFDFVNMQTGRQLEAPVIYDEPGSWIDDGSGNKVYGKAIDTYNPDLIVSGWHFSETYLPTKPDGSSGQNLQTDMPLYSYVAPDTVAVLVLANVNYEIPGGTYKTGGYTVSVKHVASNDLIQDPVTGSVRIGVNGVSDVLLFTLKKVNRFVLNADDWNAINGQISFNKNANVQVTNSDKKDVVYTNPFTDNPLYAYEVHDSLYHYGYMQFQATAGTHVGQFL